MISYFSWQLYIGLLKTYRNPSVLERGEAVILLFFLKIISKIFADERGETKPHWLLP